jgi:hypothetical protein
MRQIKFLAILTFLTCLSCWVLFPVMNARGQAAPPQFFWVCFAGANSLPNVYISGVMQGPATAGQSFQVGFAQDLAQKYSYQGAVACRPSQNANLAQSSLNGYRVAWRNAKKNVIDTGWTEAAPGTEQAAAGGTGSTTNLLGSILNSTPSKASSGAAGGAQTQNKQTSGGGNPSGGTAPQGGSAGATDVSTAASVLASLFGTNPPPAAAGSGGGSAAGAKTPQGQAAGKTAAGNGASGGGGADPNAAAAVQMASTLGGIFKKGSGGPAPGAGGNAAKPGTPAESGAGGRGPGAPAEALVPNANTPGGLPQGALGSAQYQNTMLVVYGCGRQGTDGTQVLCVTDLTNQNQKDTLLQSANVWKDVFIVDDRGDRHTRTGGYFLNIDGEQRQQMDIDYGKSAHFILAFDGVPAKVEKIELRSATGGLNVNGISPIAVGAADAPAQAQPSTAPVAPALGQATPGAARR